MEGVVQLVQRSPVVVSDEATMQALGIELARVLPERSLVTLSGELGAGKSVLVRSVIHACGYEGRVKSPTYTLIETYDCAGSAVRTGDLLIAHLDLYRLSDPEELEYLGFDDVLDSNDLVFIEWPEQGAPLLPVATLHVLIEYAENGERLVSFSDPARNA